jgi:hypothetical protein
VPSISVCGEELQPGGAVIGRVVGPPRQGLGRRGEFIGTCVPYFDINVYQLM